MDVKEEVEVGKALRTFFQAKNSKDKHRFPAYFSFKNVLYRVVSITKGAVLTFTLDDVDILLENLHNKYSTDVLEKLGILELEEEINELRLNKENLTEAEITQRLLEIMSVHEIKEANLKFATDITMFWCPNCNRVYYEYEIIKDVEHKYPKCPNCDNTILEQTPVWVRKAGEGKPILSIIFGLSDVDYQIRSSAWRNNKHIKCPFCEKGYIRVYKVEDPARFLEKSQFYCEQCNKKYSLFMKNLVLSPPTQNITRPIIAETFNRSSIKTNFLDLFDMIKDSIVVDIKFFDDIKFLNRVIVKEVVVGYWYGLKMKNIIRTDFLGRNLKTNGLYIKLKPEYFKVSYKFIKDVYPEYSPLYKRYTSLDDIDFQKVVLHSLSHALISRLPIYSGITIDNFNYIYSISDLSVLIYEIAEGGLGALRTLTTNIEDTNEPLILDFLANIRETIRGCTCDDRCKYCIAIKGCSSFNEYLNRFTIAPLFRLVVEDVSWGF